jgi:CheY-like chemotaxis protein
MPFRSKPRMTFRGASPKRILLAEDDLSVGRSTCKLLTAAGHFVALAEDGEKALALFIAGEYDVLVTDLRMLNMDGLQLTAAVKKLDPTIPVILVTGHPEAVSLKTQRALDIRFVLSKPFSQEALENALHSACRDK